jgi:coenzyme F420-0:L-glutamate ligase/coenzyme F420-1:gamma-L-glutamate ligase
MKMGHTLTSSRISVIPLRGIPSIRKGDNLAQKILSSLNRSSTNLVRGDILVVTHSIVSVAEGSLYSGEDIEPSDRARRIAEANNEDPVRVEIALKEAVEIIREIPVLLTRTRHGIITDYSGVDESNAPEGCFVALPRDPDASATRISHEISEEVGFMIPVVISDTQGRPWRRGGVNMAVGVAGLEPIISNSGREDIHGTKLRSSEVCLADEVASAAELVMGQAGESVPVAVVRGMRFNKGEGGASEILRSKEEDLFT